MQNRVVGVDISRSVRGNKRNNQSSSYCCKERVIDRKKDIANVKGEVEWYGKPAPVSTPVTGDPVICYIVGGTCFAEVGVVGMIDR